MGMEGPGMLVLFQVPLSRVALRSRQGKVGRTRPTGLYASVKPDDFRLEQLLALGAKLEDDAAAQQLRLRDGLRKLVGGLGESDDLLSVLSVPDHPELAVDPGTGPGSPDLDGRLDGHELREVNVARDVEARCPPVTLRRVDDVASHEPAMAGDLQDPPCSVGTERQLERIADGALHADVGLSCDQRERESPGLEAIWNLVFRAHVDVDNTSLRVTFPGAVVAETGAVRPDLHVEVRENCSLIETVCTHKNYLLLCSEQDILVRNSYVYFTTIIMDFIVKSKIQKVISRLGNMTVFLFRELL